MSKYSRKAWIVAGSMLNHPEIEYVSIHRNKAEADKFMQEVYACIQEITRMMNGLPN